MGQEKFTEAQLSSLLRRFAQASGSGRLQLIGALTNSPEAPTNTLVLSVLNQALKRGDLGWLHKEIPRLKRVVSSTSVSSSKKKEMTHRKFILDWLFEICASLQLRECTDRFEEQTIT